MADGSSCERTDPKQSNNLSFSVAETVRSETKNSGEDTFVSRQVNLPFCIGLKTSESSEKSDNRGGVVSARPEVVISNTKNVPNSVEVNTEGGDDRKKRCFDRYDSSESSDSGVAVLSPTESSGCSGSDITEPGSPRSPESSCGTAEEGAGTRMPPWASDPVPVAPRRLAVQPAPVRRPNPTAHRRITEFFNHKMKPQNGIKRDSSSALNDDTKRKCLPKNGVTQDLEKYISYLSKTLNPKVLLDVGKQADGGNRKISNTVDSAKSTNQQNRTKSSIIEDMLNFGRCKDDEVHTTMNGFVDIRKGPELSIKEKTVNGHVNGMFDSKKQKQETKTYDPSANNNLINNRQTSSAFKRKVPMPTPNEKFELRIAPATSVSQSPKKPACVKTEPSNNGVVSSTTKLDSRMNGVTLGSNNLSLIPNSPQTTFGKKDTAKKQPAKRTNRKSSACIANSKNLTWSKANNLKQVQKQNNCVNGSIASKNPNMNIPGEANTAPKMNIPNGVRQVSMTVNGALGNLNVTNLQNCHQLNIPQQCNGTVTANNLPSFVAMPQNVMLTTLRIPQNGLPPQTQLVQNQQNNLAAFNRANINMNNVSSPTKLNGQFVFPLVQNINGAVVQIPNLMAKMPNFVLPQTPQMSAQRQDHLQNQQATAAAAQFLINGTLLKLTNTMTTQMTHQYTTNVNKTIPASSQSIPTMNKNVSGIQVGMTVQPKQNFTVNLSHSVLMPQPGFIVTSVPNTINVKETWSSLSANTAVSTQSTCSLVQHPPIVTNFSTQALHTSSIPLAPVKPPDNPIQGTDPPSSTVKEPEVSEIKLTKCDIPWLSKTVNNNIVPLDCNKLTSRPFAQVSSINEKIQEFSMEKPEKSPEVKEEPKGKTTGESLRKVEEVARREETIFTQITVLKDVSSNVQSSVIEAFSSSTTESSESGIGTDKSIDSPSDSQASKECDDDSSLSLSVSVCSVEVESCQKSPILKQPKTLRFPPRSLVKGNSNQRTSSTDTTATVIVCLWENCKREFDSDTDLLEHLQSVHVETQVGKENFVCLWERCKVRGKPSCSRLWLERHTLSHGGNKPFKCIVDGCDRRFSTQILLERHVNNHFSETSPNTSGGKKTADSAAKLIRRNGKRLRYRRQPWSARMFDFFDTGTMEGLAWRLSRCTRWRLGGACPLREPAGRHTLTVHSMLLATRYNAAEARREALVTYYPPNVVDDEWVPVKEVKRIKRVEIGSLPANTKVLLYEQFCASYRKASSPPPQAKLKAKPAVQPVRQLPARQCTSSRLLNNLLSKKKVEAKYECSANNLPLVLSAEPEQAEVSGAKKRKMGRRYGGNAFWPCGR